MGQKVFVGEKQVREAVSNFLDKANRRLRENRKLHGRTSFQSIPISVENRKGSIRRGKDKDGGDWETKMKLPYGYIPGTEGADGDHLDVFVGPNEDASHAYVVHINCPDTGKYDEDKVMLGFDSADKAKSVFMQHYDDPKFFGGMDTIPMWKFHDKAFVKKETTKRLVASFREARRLGYGGQAHIFTSNRQRTMKKSLLGHHQDQMLNPTVRESKADNLANLAKARRAKKKLQKQSKPVVHRHPPKPTHHKKSNPGRSLGQRQADEAFIPAGVHHSHHLGEAQEHGVKGQKWGSIKDIAQDAKDLHDEIERHEGYSRDNMRGIYKDMGKVVSQTFKDRAKKHKEESGVQGMKWSNRTPKEIIERAGGRHMGSMDHPKGGKLHTFTDPKTGSTLAMRDKDIQDPQAVRDHMNNSRRAFGRHDAVDEAREHGVRGQRWRNKKPDKKQEEENARLRKIGSDLRQSIDQMAALRHDLPERILNRGHESRRKAFHESERRFLREASGVYYARPMPTYGSDQESEDMDLIESMFPDDEIDAPATCKKGVEGMAPYHKRVDASKAVVIRPFRKNRVSAGVWSEARHALKKGIPVHMIRRGKLYEVESVRVRRHPVADGDFGDVILKKRNK